MSTVRETGPPPTQNWPTRACAGTDTRVFFPGKEGGGRDWVLERLAKSICGRCEAINACKAYAVPVADLSGIWAGMNEGQRSKERARLGMPGRRGARQQKEA